MPMVDRLVLEARKSFDTPRSSLDEGTKESIWPKRRWTGRVHGAHLPIYRFDSSPCEDDASYARYDLLGTFINAAELTGKGARNGDYHYFQGII